ncbi:hypothetical protein JW805_20930 [Roseomonas aeriglobus]|nr:hypothetical protein [Roseomonas aeriglobus]MBN2974456.1 hypothetical protein [Roseomonas aeriglobus]
MASTIARMWRTNIFASYLILSVACAIYAQSIGRTFLSNDLLDGFTIQVTYIWNYFSGGNSIFKLEPLLWIHSARALIAYIFVSVEDIFGVGSTSFLILLMYLPIVKEFANAKRGFFVFALPLSILVFSPRTALVIVSVAYLLMFIFRGKAYLYLLPSLFLSTLSSGVVLSNLIITLLLVRNYRRRSFALYLYASTLAISLLISVGDKYIGFNEQRAGYNSTVYGASGISAIISRSTIFVSLQEGNFVRFFAYIALAVLAMLLLFVSIRMRRYRGYAAILLAAVPSVFLEGLGFVSLLVPVLLLMAGRPLPWRPEPVERTIG